MGRAVQFAQPSRNQRTAWLRWLVRCYGINSPQVVQFVTRHSADKVWLDAAKHEMEQNYHHVVNWPQGMTNWSVVLLAVLIGGGLGVFTWLSLTH